eukprot:4351895-Alexandrium_andersonii.AAC.1
MILEAGQRALIAAPLPTIGGEQPLSDDGPDEEMLAAAAGQVPPTAPKEEVKEEPKEDGTQESLKPSEAPGTAPHGIKVRPSSSLGAYARSGPAAAGAVST